MGQVDPRKMKNALWEESQAWVIPNTLDFRSNGPAYEKKTSLFVCVLLTFLSLFLFHSYNNISLQQQITAGPLKKKALARESTALSLSQFYFPSKSMPTT